MFELYGTYSMFCLRLVFIVLIEMFECAKFGSVTDNHEIMYFKVRALITDIRS